MPNCKDCVHFPVCAELKNLSIQGCGLYKDKERVVELPCKIGDTLYRITKRGQIEEGTATAVFYGKIFHIVNWSSPKINTGIPFHRIGKTVFLTREEAERALNEQREGNR